jgi:hypothetical protein
MWALQMPGRRSMRYWHNSTRTVGYVLRVLLSANGYIVREPVVFGEYDIVDRRMGFYEVCSVLMERLRLPERLYLYV